MSTATEMIPVADVDARAAEVERQVAEARQRAEAIEVRNPEEAERAARLLREIAARRKAAETERRELKAPIIEAGKRLDQKFKDAMAPFDPVDKIVRDKLGVYEAEQERIRREEQERIDRETAERERIAREAREVQEAEERRKREQAEREQREADELAAAAKDEEERAAAEALAEEAREKAAEAATAEAAISSLPEIELPTAVVPAAPKPTGISQRKVWKATVVDAALVPREYLAVDEKLIKAAVREGVREIPGVSIEQVDQMAVRG